MTGRRPSVLLFTVAWALAAAWAGTVEVAGKVFHTTTMADRECVALSDLVQTLNGKCWRVGNRFVVVLPGSDSTRPGSEYVFRPDTTLVLCDSRRILLPSRPVVEDGALFLPAVGLADMFPGIARPLLGIVETAMQGETLVVSVPVRRTRRNDTLVAYGERRSSFEYRLTVDAGRDSGLIAQLGLLTLTGNAILKTVCLDSGAGTSLLFSSRQPVGERLLVAQDRIELRFWPSPQRRIRHLVIDAGHGGKDPGAIGRLKTEEKRTVMDVAHRLQKKLVAQGFEVTVTRDTDVFVSLAERSWCANERKADLFVSIHANASPNRRACGVETYFLSEAKTDWERAVAARENAALEIDNGRGDSGVGGDIGLILADLAQNEYLYESSELAARIQQAAVRTARVKDRGVRQANFYVLRNNFMPAVLVEVGFLSNRSEEKLLRKPEHRQRLADGICAGVVAFAQQFGPGPQAPKEKFQAPGPKSESAPKSGGKGRHAAKR